MNFNPATGEVFGEHDPAEAPGPCEGEFPATHADADSSAGIDFEVFARDAAELAGEHLGIRLSAGGFRQLVIDGDAPAPIPGTDRWSQKAVMEWVARKLSTAEAEDEGNKAEDSEKESKPVHHDVFDFWDRTYSVYYEVFNTTPNALRRASPEMAWCRKWWLHRGVVGRITAAWYAWEAAHAEGGAAISAWILEHADRHFDRIMAENGPLRECKGEHTDALDIYPTDPVPESLRTPTEDEGEME